MTNSKEIAKTNKVVFNFLLTTKELSKPSIGTQVLESNFKAETANTHAMFDKSAIVKK